MIHKLRIKIVALVLATCLLLLVVVLGFVFHATKVNIMGDALGSMEWVIMDINTDRYYGIPKGAPRPMAILFQDAAGELELSDQWDMEQVTAAAELTDIARRVLAVEENSGYYSLNEDILLAYRYEFLKDGRTVIILTNVSRNKEVLQIFQKNAVIASGAAMAVMVLLGILFACWVVRPIAQAQESQQNFFAAASHDLKTPLTIILSNIALLLDSPEEEPQRTQYYRNIQSGAAQMKTLTQNMLDNISFESMAKNRSLPMENQVDFSYLVQKTLSGFEALCYEFGRSLQYDLEESLRIRGNPDALERLIGILMDNALKYSDERSHIYVRLKSSAGSVALEFHSEAEPINKEELSRIFQPFYRIDKARSDHGSYGLGLSIAKNIVIAHNGSISVTTEGQKNIFHVILPKTTAS